jgi:hypothetical protein
MTRKKIENKIESLETQQDNSEKNGIYFVEKTSDGTKICVDPDTGDRIERCNMPDNSIIINLQE